MKHASLFNRAALGIATLVLAGCQTLQKPNTDTCMQERSMRALLFNTGGTTYNTDCNDGRTAYALLKRSGDPVGNALGFLLYMDQNKAAKEMLEARMGGKEKVKVEPETVAGLLLSGDETSRYVGFQIYAASPEEARKNVNTILIAEKADPKAILSLDLSRERSTAMAWAREHALAPADTPATVARLKRDDCTKIRTTNGVTWSCPKPAAPASQ